ncbi:MAG: [FeFe] hydrogenase H-cluster radical SAM maturase HydG [Candidatus Diapherotrites archaeon CG08_land_8_20_14_0_20_34_12]|nr:MAG: [FeFe] hydrogenase H-cluster radical SAM maturase HydG [Candidatus Diapherotrites archaeon CG08_land_8_20_14_0_20_34_12]
MNNTKFDKKEFLKVIEKAKKLQGLNLRETAILLSLDVKKNKSNAKELFDAAHYVKEQIYGSRIVLFAPLYLGNYCVNNCLYCGFRVENSKLKRKVLDEKELKKEVIELLKQGQKRLLLVVGESKLTGIDYLENAIKKVYSIKQANGQIRRVNVNAPPLSVKEFKRLKKAGIGTYQLFQETYHYETYKKVHPSGPKADYKNRLFVMDRAQKAGIDDVGLGVLFGLYDYKFEVLALLQHVKHLEKKFNVGPHTISMPRIEHALNAPLTKNPPCQVSDNNFKKLIAVLRLAVPYTGMILSTREKAEFRDKLFELGISQISAGSRTNPGGYAESEQNKKDEQQFELHDSRTLSEIVSNLCNKNYLPSFCTACYRLGRTGDKFMELAKPGNIQNFCLPNALLTFKEYLVDYAKQNERTKGEEKILSEIKNIPDKKIRELTLKKLKRIEKGKRDLYF